MPRLSATVFALTLLVTLPTAGLMSNSARAQQTQQAMRQDDASSHAAPLTRPLLPEYRGLKLGMNREQVKAVMQKASRSSKEWEEFKLADGELMTAHYDAQDLVRTIQILFTDSAHAPSWAEVVGGAEIRKNPSGSEFARAVNQEENFWITMFRSKSGAVTTVTISR